MRKAFKKAFGRRLFHALQDLGKTEGTGVSQGEVAARVAKILREKPKSDNTVSQWRNGKSLPDVITIFVLAEVLDVSPCWLAFGDGEMLAGGEAKGGGPAPELAPKPRRTRVTSTDLAERKRKLKEARGVDDREEEE